MTYIKVVESVKVINWPEQGIKRERNSISLLSFSAGSPLLILATLYSEVLNARLPEDSGGPQGSCISICINTVSETSSPGGWHRMLFCPLPEPFPSDRTAGRMHTSRHFMTVTYWFVVNHCLVSSPPCFVPQTLCIHFDFRHAHWPPIPSHPPVSEVHAGPNSCSVSK